MRSAIIKRKTIFVGYFMYFYFSQTLWFSKRPFEVFYREIKGTFWGSESSFCHPRPSFLILFAYSRPFSDKIRTILDFFKINFSPHCIRVGFDGVYISWTCLLDAHVTVGGVSRQALHGSWIEFLAGFSRL